ncbi:MAG: hypothetical protein Q8R28_14940 [Dehalococcoidia bacterium]|nr:hypothetical protein [Dehalococcoidia bacterium]
MYYVCDEHQRAWEEKKSARGHWNFFHKGEKVDDIDTFLQEAVPEGYTLAPAPGGGRDEGGEGEDLEAPAPRARSTRSSTTKPLTMPKDPDAAHLHKRLMAIGVRQEEVDIITRGYAEIEYLRADPNALADWLDTHVSDRKLKRWIPTVVHDMMQLTAHDQRAAYFPPGGPPGGTQPPFYYPPAPNPYEHPYGYPTAPRGYPYAPPAPPPWYYPPAAPTATAAEPDEATQAALASLNETVQTLGGQLQRERQERLKEREENERKERERHVEQRMDKLEDLIKEAVSQRKPDDTPKYDPILEELRAMRADMTSQQTAALNARLEAIAQDVRASKGQSVGRTTEDLVSEILPTAGDRVDRLGDRVVGELRGLREQALPRSAPTGSGIQPIHMDLGPRSTEDVVRLAEVENEFMDADREDGAAPDMPEPEAQERIA